MRKFFLLGLAILLLGSCDLLMNKCHVRFQNSTTDYALYYGVKFGDAAYVGAVPPGFISSYYESAAGTFSLQGMNSSGQWVTISNGSFTASAGDSYTVIGTGSTGTYYWALVRDS